MSTSTLTATRVRVLPPSTVRPRGTLLVVPGRGEHLGHYGRFAQRIAADGYVVDVLDALPSGAAALSDLLAEIDVEESAIDGPRVLVGVDSGAAVVVDAVRRGLVSPAAVIVAGAVVGEAVSEAADDASEIALRTSCPVHRGLLGEDPRYARAFGEVTDAARAWGVSVASREPSGTANGPWYVGIPVLALHGTDDEVSPLREVVRALSWWPDAELLVVRDGVHDVLNDASHRSVAASVVQFLERVRSGNPHRSIVVRVPLGNSVESDGTGI